jgi:uncharacterized protein YndB with AHSA1/START domain
MTETTSAEVVCAAPPEAVWRVLTDGPRWADWNEAVEWLWFEDGVRAGALATIKPRRFRQTAFRITAAVEARELALQITVGPAARLAFRWTLAAAGGGTRITESVAVSGVAAAWLFAPAARRAAAALDARLARLAELAAEKSRAADFSRATTDMK